MKHLFLAIYATFLAIAGPAWGAVYECSIDQLASNGRYLPEVLALEVSGDTATVSDPLIMLFKEGPIEAKIVVDNDKRITVAWRLKVKNNSNQYANMAYRLTIIKAGLQASMSSQPLPYDDQFAAQGTCRMVKG